MADGLSVTNVPNGQTIVSYRCQCPGGHSSVSKTIPTPPPEVPCPVCPECPECPVCKDPTPFYMIIIGVSVLINIVLIFALIMKKKTSQGRQSKCPEYTEPIFIYITIGVISFGIGFMISKKSNWIKF
jgi:general stress protein CsbA